MEPQLIILGTVSGVYLLEPLHVFFEIILSHSEALYLIFFISLHSAQD
jgi:hypothetical protein